MRIFLFVCLAWLCAPAPLAAQYPTELYVAQDSSGDYTTIQAAIDATKSFPDSRIIIYIKSGVYKEKVRVPAWNNRLTLKGEDAQTTIIRWADYFDGIGRGRNSTFFTSTLLIQGDEVHIEDLTIENSAGDVGQAVAVAVEADRVVFRNCRLLGHQDTLYVSGANARQYFSNCYIEGTTDFIFGQATALFESCTLHSKRNSFITAASTPAGRPFGLVFLRCRLTADPGVDAVYLGRPWRDYAQTAFLYCEMGGHIRPEGWDNWSSPQREATTHYVEFGNTGPGASAARRVGWSRQLSEKEARHYYPEQILRPFALPLMGLDDH